MVTSFDLITNPSAKKVKEIMSTDVVVTRENMTIHDAARVMFREGVSRLPVVNGEGKVVGIITNTDIIRSHIERSTPTKVSYFRNTLKQIYNVKTEVKRKRIPLKKLRPTQGKIYADELKGRTYELKRGLAEPIIAVKTGDHYVIVDGHHRVVAAHKLGYKEIDAYVIHLDKDIKLGIEKSADKNKIYSIDDIEVIDEVQHPLTTITTVKRRKDEDTK